MSRPNDFDVCITRDFSAARDQVYRALTEPELLQAWLTGPPGWIMTECLGSTRTGGEFQHTWRSSTGEEITLVGTYREVVSNERIVRTERMAMGCSAQAAEQLARLELTAIDAATRLTMVVTFPSSTAREAALAAGMTRGLAAGYGKLDALLAGHESTETASGERRPS